MLKESGMINIRPAINQFDENKLTSSETKIQPDYKY